MRLIIIGGPTASGKSALAMKLALQLNGEIISADSVQVYQGLDIGSAKPGPDERKLVRHHLIDVLKPIESMDAGLFVRLAEQALRNIAGRGKAAIVVGGTGLYIRALLYGLAQVPAIEPALREELKQKLQILGAEALHQQLAVKDPQSAARIKPADKQRIVRALEVVLQTGKTIGYYQQQHDRSPRYSHLLWAVQVARDQLRYTIEQRARQMWQNGLLAEVGRLLAAGVPPQAPALQSLGYQQAVDVLIRQRDETDALNEMIRLTQAYAKRQVTWFKKMPGIQWVAGYEQMLATSRDFLQDV